MVLINISSEELKILCTIISNHARCLEEILKITIFHKINGMLIQKSPNHPNTGKLLKNPSTLHSVLSFVPLLNVKNILLSPS